MWAALTNDFKEFVSGVEDETAVVSTKLIETVESLERIGGTTGENGEVLESGFEATGLVSNATDEVARRRHSVETYTEPLDESKPDVVAFLESFDLESKTEKIATLLATSAIIKERFEEVCPEEVAYKDFWLRYFYRCNQKRIELEWKEIEEANKKAREAVISSSIASVTSLFGGAVKAVTKAVERNDKSASDVVPTSPFGFSGGTSMFSGARPPFVLNTAVNDDEEEEEEEEVEEELGWGDDDSFDDDDEAETPIKAHENPTEDPEEEIEFSGGASDDKLTQALEERDALQQTVKLQAMELAALKTGKESPSLLRELEELKMKLFEKDAELAAVKASGEDSEMDNKQAKLDFDRIKSLEAAVKELQEAKEKQAAQMVESKNEFEKKLLAQAKESDAKMSGLESAKAALECQALDNSTGQLTAALQAAALAKDKCKALQAQLVDANTQLSDAAKSRKQLEDALAETIAKLNVQEGAFETRYDEQAAAFEAATTESASGFQSAIDTLYSQLQTALTDLQLSNEKVTALTLELALVKEKRCETTPPPSKMEELSNDTLSTGVQVDPPVTSIPVPISEPADAEEDWGDDW